MANKYKYYDGTNWVELLKSSDISAWAKASTKPSYSASEISGLATVATSGSYNDLINKPTIPTVNNAKLTIQGNGTTASEFTANASSDVTLNIKGSGATTVTKSANNEITISSTNSNDNQTVKTSSVTFGANDAVQITAGSNITVTGDASAKTITIAGTANTATAADNILDGSNSGTEITYAPYSSQQSRLSFDTSSTAPTRTDRLNLNGNLYATNLYSGGNKVITEAGISVGSGNYAASMAFHVVAGSGGSSVTLPESYLEVSTGGLISSTAQYKPNGINYDSNFLAFPTASGTIATQTWVENKGYTTNTGTVIGSGLTTDYFVLGNSGVNVKISSLKPTTSSTTWSESSDVNVPTMKAISSYVTGKGYTTNTGTITGVSINGTSVATSGVANITAIPYSILTGTPTIPTVNNATLTIQQNSTSLGTFTANASSNTTINVITPKVYRYI